MIVVSHSYELVNQLQTVKEREEGGERGGGGKGGLRLWELGKR